MCAVRPNPTGMLEPMVPSFLELPVARSSEVRSKQNGCLSLELYDSSAYGLVTRWLLDGY